MAQTSQTTFELGNGEISFDPTTCQSCFPQADNQLKRKVPLKGESEIPNLSAVPTCHHDLKEVFSNAKATSPKL